ncbi:bifunctional folylpolyglutamate synthase/dihydrofolate synthase [Cohnella hashimotonis]|uniref:tetrahydrofolate synthase n=1 Tax=Cohnella hashimotonis TaxID=2826895 RepID=A0ABT6TDK2_9BACL|nr:folylpolyglutamate synthase/dihydrofolate synthase family protein [Cohnella hashimotonis]MDI4644849.1 folylpolyglutamate synthase/dihydrofolate synthase family protein [Cohnella hashimotonis]
MTTSQDASSQNAHDLTSANDGGEASFRTAAEAVGWISGLAPVVGIKPGLERMELLLERLNYPHRRLRFIHVAGTNGKGSVCAMLASVLRQSGYDVGLFTSPYLTSFADRIDYNGEAMPEEAIVRLANRLKPLSDELADSKWGPLTAFELTTAMAILYYATVTFPDYVVWETGLGGRLDVTNVVTPVVSIITNVGHDHMDLLGDTIADIAREKAGIVKSGVPVVSTVLQPEAAAIVKETAASRQATLYQLGEQFSYESRGAQEENEAQAFDFRDLFRGLDDVRIGLAGMHQQTNAAAAIMAIDVLRTYYALIVDEADLREGLGRAAWPGRLELISREPRILLDGAHNPEGMAALAEALRQGYPRDKLNVLLAMMPNKNHEGALRHILPMVSTLVVTEPDHHRKMGAEALADVARRAGRDAVGAASVIVEPDWRKALEKIQSLAAADPEENTLTLVTGTLYLIADVRSWLLERKTSDKGW